MKAGAAKIYCCGCLTEITARLSDGAEVYPHRTELASLPFWLCDRCHNYVGCHHKSKDRTKPLGCIPTKDLRELRKKIHQVIDPIWQAAPAKRCVLYRHLGSVLGRSYHTADIRSAGEAQKILERSEEHTSELQSL